VSRPAKFQLSPDKIAQLLTSGRNHIADGRIAEARTVFRRAAEACDAYAAFALGATYDPTLLQKLGVRTRALAPDLANARTWYEKAKKLGSAEASDQLELLANLGNLGPSAKAFANTSVGVAASSGTAPTVPLNGTQTRRHQQKAARSDAGLIPWLDLFGRF
jgi:TPR repeat protein